jgi:hypothetical protein
MTKADLMGNFDDIVTDRRLSYGMWWPLPLGRSACKTASTRRRY